jgi:ArsR family transcriptional regulator
MPMPIAKHAARTARLFHALADETRLHIIEKLCQGELCVCDLTASLRTPQSLLSFHLKTLKDTGLVRDRREGRWVYYSLDADRLAGLQDYLEELRKDSTQAGGTASTCT